MSKADASGQAGLLIEQMFVSFCEDNDIPIKENILNEKFTNTQEPVVGDIIEDHEGNKIEITEEPEVVDNILGLNIYECASNNKRIIFNKLQVEEHGMRLQ